MPDTHFPLALKLTLATTLLIVAVTVTVTGMATRREARAFHDELEGQALLLLTVVASSSVHSSHNPDLDFLRQTVAVLGGDPRLTSARAYDANARVIADSSDRTIAATAPPDGFGSRILAAPEPIIEWLPDRLRVGRPVVIDGRRVGAVSLELSRKPLELRMADLRLQGFRVALTAALFGALLAVLIARSITAPLQSLTQAMRQVTAGDLAQTITLRSRDELAVLASGFNGMVIRLRETMEGLEHRIAERTQQFSQAKQEAERASLAKSEFLSRMSHELRTPLNAILGFAQLLELEPLSTEQGESVQHILTGGRHLLALINEVLDIARIEAGRLAISLEPVSVKEVVKESLDLIAPLASAEDVSLEGHLGGTPDRYVRADRQRLKQVLLNLLSNAVKYNRRAGTVTLLSEEVPGGRLRIKVTDSGPGIPPEYLKRLFIPFERLERGQTRVEGTGLGLTLSRGLVDAMDGTLGVESTIGVGSTFWVELAVVDNPLKELEEMRKDGADPGKLLSSSGSRAVLYIEDNLSNFELIRRLLAHRPEVRILPAMLGRLGLDLARQHHPHLILLDLHLADIKGEEVLRRLREDPETRHIPVVVISSDATSAQIGRLLAAGAQACLTKPVDIKKLLKIVDETLCEREQGHPARNA
jgi:signal transduction histidine kinase/CheY-like chemotaxis protein